MVDVHSASVDPGRDERGLLAVQNDETDQHPYYSFDLDMLLLRIRPVFWTLKIEHVTSPDV